MTDSNKSGRAVFAGKFAAVATTVGSAVGLGNIWRFPYEAGEHGGGAFLLCYIVFALLIGVPVLTSEFIMGRCARSNVSEAYAVNGGGNRWRGIGHLGIITSLLILGFYAVVAGWTAEYFINSLTGQADFSSEKNLHSQFLYFTSGWRPLVWTLLFSLINFLILARGVTKGIERMSNVLMPLLFLLLVIFCIHSIFLPGFNDGVEFLFKPDFSKITPKVLLGALGQAFFSLSLGVGCMMTYASYFSDSTRLGRTAVTTMLLDSTVAIMSGLIIFPAVFSYGLSPSAGPTLVFEVLPNIFSRMSGGMIWSTLFFLLLLLASLTSTVSMSEISISYFSEAKRLDRKGATMLSCGIALLLSTLCALSFWGLSEVKIFGMTFFDLFDYVSSNIFMPIGGIASSLFVGWVMDRKAVAIQLSNGHERTATAAMMRALVFFLRWICPVAIFIIFLDSVGLLRF